MIIINGMGVYFHRAWLSEIIKCWIVVFQYFHLSLFHVKQQNFPGNAHRCLNTHVQKILHFLLKNQLIPHSNFLVSTFFYSRFSLVPKDLWGEAIHHDRILGLLALLCMCSTCMCSMFQLTDAKILGLTAQVRWIASPRGSCWPLHRWTRVMRTLGTRLQQILTYSDLLKKFIFITCSSTVEARINGHPREAPSGSTLGKHPREAPSESTLGKHPREADWSWLLTGMCINNNTVKPLLTDTPVGGHLS